MHAHWQGTVSLFLINYFLRLNLLKIKSCIKFSKILKVQNKIMSNSTSSSTTTTTTNNNKSNRSQRWGRRSSSSSKYICKYKTGRRTKHSHRNTSRHTLIENFKLFFSFFLLPLSSHFFCPLRLLSLVRQMMQKLLSIYVFEFPYASALSMQQLLPPHYSVPFLLLFFFSPPPSSSPPTLSFAALAFRVEAEKNWLKPKSIIYSP